MQGRIVRILSKDYTVLLEDGQRVNAVALGRLRKGFSPVVGDLVEIRESRHAWASRRSKSAAAVSCGRPVRMWIRR